MATKTTTKPRGFAAMSAADRIRIARLGGLAVHRLGNAHEWTSEEAKIAGRIGGKRGRRSPAIHFKEEL